MPATQVLPVNDLYFDSLEELDLKRRSFNRIINNQLDWIAQKTSADARGRLLVCHDYKGGYTESPFSLSYTFNYWFLCDIFVYFSHHRVTIPPPGWVDAAHRQGVKILGTLIFEKGAEPDCLRLVVGKLPTSNTGPAVRPSHPTTLPVSPHYARLLAGLAHERGFDGYLLNFECHLQGGLEQTRSLAAWISLLHSELVEKVGPHAEVVWYDSVIFTGQLAWQDRLNSLNLPFLIPSTSFFSNYTWKAHYPNATAQYFLTLEQDLVGAATESKPKTLQDIYMGVDVWGRGSHGGGGFGCYKAIEHISPDSLGLSVALFGQAWTWESEQDKPGWNWDKWWKYERDLWVGSPDPAANIALPTDARNPDCPHGMFMPFSSFFIHHPPPDPLDLYFHTTFCPGVGRSWFVAGETVFESLEGWTDINKQTSMGNLLWPRPSLAQVDCNEEESLPIVALSVYFDDAWSGGSSIRLVFTDPRTHEERAYRSFWLPIQSLGITTQQTYTMSIVYKSVGHDNLHVDMALIFKLLRSSETEAQVEIVPDSAVHTDLTSGWTKITLQFSVANVSALVNVEGAMGLIVTTVSEDPTIPFEFSMLLGQVNVYPSPPSHAESHDPHILWVDCTTSSTPSHIRTRKPGLDNVAPREQMYISQDNTEPRTTILDLNWEVASSLPPVTHVEVKSPEDPFCVWTPEPSASWFPRFLYFNIYATPFTRDLQSHSTGINVEISHPNGHGHKTATWIGTSGLDGRLFGFTFEREKLPPSIREAKRVQFFVQGVLDTGEVLSWDRCAYVDVRFD